MARVKKTTEEKIASVVKEIEVLESRLKAKRTELNSLKKLQKKEIAENLIEAMEETNKDVSKVVASLKFASRLQDEIEKYGKSMNDVLEYVRRKD